MVDPNRKLANEPTVEARAERQNHPPSSALFEAAPRRANCTEATSIDAAELAALQAGEPLLEGTATFNQKSTFEPQQRKLTG